MAERSTSKVACGFALSFLLYTVYILSGIAVVVLPQPKPQNASETRCRLHLKVYAGIGTLAALRSLLSLCRSFYRYLQKQHTFPTEREQWMRVGIKAYVALHGVILFVILRRMHDLQATRHSANELWLFFVLTVWSNVVSCCLLPFNLKSSLEQARRIRQEEQQNSRMGYVGSSDRPLSGSNLKAYQYMQHDLEESPANLVQSPGGLIGVQIEARLS